MSQHYVLCEYGDTPCVLMAGWDKPPQSAYLTLGFFEGAGGDWVEPLLLDMCLSFDRVNNAGHAGELITRMKGGLERFGLKLPDSLCSGVLADIQSNSVNKMTLHGTGGEPEVLTESPFDSGLFVEMLKEVE